MRELLNRFYPVEHCKKQGAFLDKSEAEAEEEDADKKKKKDKKAYFRSGKGGASDHFSIVAVTLALGKQLLLEHEKVTA